MPETLPKLQFLTGTNPDLSHAEEAEKACKGGVRFIQFRKKQASGDVLRKMAMETLEVCRQYEAIFIIDDAVEIARDIGAEGVHLGYDDMPPKEARQKLGHSAIIGGTGNDFDHVQNHVSQGVDYLGIGPYRYTASKQSLKPVLGLEGYKSLLEKMHKAGITTPIYAIGGIQTDDIPPLLNIGIYGIAVSSGIGQAGDIEKAARNFVEAVGIGA